MLDGALLALISGQPPATGMLASGEPIFRIPYESFHQEKELSNVI
jgi:hypothetical protein